jgi:hypothetical protein
MGKRWQLTDRGGETWDAARAASELLFSWLEQTNPPDILSTMPLKSHPAECCGT